MPSHISPNRRRRASGPGPWGSSERARGLRRPPWCGPGYARRERPPSRSAPALRSYRSPLVQDDQDERKPYPADTDSVDFRETLFAIILRKFSSFFQGGFRYNIVSFVRSDKERNGDYGIRRSGAR
jgi:hypothetical protein